VSDQDRPRRAWRTEERWLQLRERVTAAEDNAGARRRTYWQAAAATAAAVVVAAALGASALSRRDAASRAPVPFVVTTAPGQRTTVRLSDSSEVTLGPASGLSFVADDGGREVRLEGMAAFTVVHDTARPFVVRARNSVTTDLGTEFVVRAYATDSVVEVSVTSGEVSLASSSDVSSAVTLRAGDDGLVTARGAARRVARARASASMAWVEGRLVFDDVELGAAAAELGRWFDVDIRVPAATLSRRRVSAIYNNPTLDGVLNALATTVGARYERDGRTITLRPGVR
jgi:transmembrane sensor